jgi:anti-sigma regulatory factor (Ser/Thr protein kinase)
VASTPDLAVELRGGYYFGQLERLIRDLQPLFEVEGGVRIEIDLTHLVFIGPTALALLLAAANRAGELVEEVMIYPPTNPLTSRYFRRSDFVKLFVHAEVAEDFERKKPKGFRPCAHFTTDEEGTAVARDLGTALLERVPQDRIARAGIVTALSELTENVFYHADTPLGGYAAAAYSKRKRVIEIGIVDLGIGMRASLSKNPELPETPDDVEAVRQAMRPTISSTPERNSGFGLAFTQGLLLANGGQMRVRSGHGAATIGPGVEYPRREHNLPGTLVLLRALADKPLDATAAWDDLINGIKRVIHSHTSHGSSAR